MIAVILAALAVATLEISLNDLGALGDVFSILGLLITLGVFYIAQRLYSRAGHAKESVLREKDARSRKHVADTIDLCRSTVRVIKKSKKSTPTVGNMAMMRHIVASN